MNMLMSIAECNCGVNCGIDSSSSTASDLYDDVLFHHSIMPKEVSVPDHQDEIEITCESFSTALSFEQAGNTSSGDRNTQQDMLVLSSKESFNTARNGDALSCSSSNLLSVGLSEDDDLSYATIHLSDEEMVLPANLSMKNEENVVSNIEALRSHSVIYNLPDLDATIVTTGTTAPTIEHTEGRSIDSFGNTSF